jgi:tRNA pseudouridine38-40 synthase
MRIKLTIAYDGSNYFGFQHQEGHDTIELRLTEAISKINKIETKIIASGRTDRYVHAKGQVVHFDTNLKITEKSWIKAINSYLPDDIRVLEASFVNDDFHARFSAKLKEYRYYIQTSYDLFNRNYSDFFTNIDFDLVEKAASKLIGTHDFRGFCSKEVHDLKDTVRTIHEIKITEVKPNLYEFSFIGTGFLKYQIKRMMGIIINIGLKKLDISIIDQLFITKDPTLCGKTLSGRGLFLYRVIY